MRKFERHSEIDEWQSYEKCSSLLYHEAAFHTSHILDHIFFCKFELHVIFCKQTNFRANKKIFPLCIITYFRHEFRPSMHCKPSNVRTNLTTAYQRCYRKAQWSSLMINENFALWKEAGPPPAKLALSRQQTMIVNNRFPALPPFITVDNHQWRDDGHAWFTTAVVHHQTRGRSNICTQFAFKTRISPQGSVCRMWMRQ